MKKTVFLLSLVTTTILLGACATNTEKTSSHNADNQKQSTIVTKKKQSSAGTTSAAANSKKAMSESQNSTATSKAAAKKESQATTQQSQSSAQGANTTQSNNATGQSKLSIPADVLSAYRTAIKQAGLDSSAFSDQQLNGYYLEANKSGDVGTLLQFIARDKGMDVNQLLNSYYSYNGLNQNGSQNATMPAEMLQSYRTAIAQAGLDATSFSDDQLNHYYQQNHLSGDVGTLLQSIARDRGLDVNELLNNYYRYNGQTSNGSQDATMPADMLQAYRNVITQAGLDATSFSDAQLNQYYRDAHLSGDAGTLLQFIARDRGLDFNQLLATYQGQ
ncbi:hypothetical protein [Enterococcus sp. CSURQ0835]|uniref:hypothetical protein n=1 Tax=Enterococcus sp. CSURQ0835 TaxID=2681394 RepID=UPI00135ABBEB|nr:hypothetical protein [Enterococcus sp. CSURQ0835]